MFSQDTMLEHHLTYNHYPPISNKFVPVAKLAIEACEKGQCDNRIHMPNGVTLTAEEIVDGMHLEGFVNQDEQCSVCGQPDNCGDCNHEPAYLTD